MYKIEYEFGDEYHVDNYIYEEEYCEVYEALAYILADEIVYKDKTIDVNTAMQCARCVIKDNEDYYLDIYKEELKEYFKDKAYEQMLECENFKF